MSCLIYTHAKIHKKVEEKKKLFVFLSFLCDFLDIFHLFTCNFTLFADIFDVNCHEERGEGKASLRSFRAFKKIIHDGQKIYSRKLSFLNTKGTEETENASLRSLGLSRKLSTMTRKFIPENKN